MPKVEDIGPYRFYFYSHETIEPAHIHVDRDNLSAKLRLNPVGIAKNIGFNAKELNKLFKIVTENKELFLKAWDEFFI
jgi:hypothetical protein